MPAEKLYTSPKEHIFKDMSESMELPIDYIEKVISWSYMKANQAVKENREVEISGLGKLMVSQAKLRRRIQSLEMREQNEKNIEELKYVKTKLK